MEIPQGHARQKPFRRFFALLFVFLLGCLPARPRPGYAAQTLIQSPHTYPTPPFQRRSAWINPLVRKWHRNWRPQ